MMQKFRVNSIDMKRCTMRARPVWVNQAADALFRVIPSRADGEGPHNCSSASAITFGANFGTGAIVFE